MVFVNSVLIVAFCLGENVVGFCDGVYVQAFSADEVRKLKQCDNK